MNPLFLKGRKPSFLLIIAPNTVVNPDAIPEDFDFEQWRVNFSYTEDRVADLVQPIKVTIEEQHGDCDDFTAVAASWMLTQDFDDVWVGFLSRPLQVLPSHTVAVGRREDQTVVFSNGARTFNTLEEWGKLSGYKSSFKRRVG